ncbi:cytochrome c biogenesis protein CcsA [bacterium]|nr:cytochrome c biogenesis protein CcsA [bacterium]
MGVLHSVFLVLLPMVYLVVWATYMWLFLKDHPLARRLATRLALTAVVLDLAAEIHQAFELQRLPMGSPLEFMGLLAWALLATYLVIEKRLGAKNTGFLITGMAFLLRFLSSALTRPVHEASPFLSDPGFAGHAVLILLAYTALSLSFLYAILYLILARQLMRRQFGLLFRRLPSLDILERMSIGGVELGLPLLFLALCLGHLWMYDLAERVSPEMAAMLSPWDPKILATWVIFLAYVAGLAGYHFLGWRGRRMNIMAVVGYLTVMAAMGAIQHFFPSFHKFRPDPARAETGLLREGPAAADHLQVPGGRG